MATIVAISVQRVKQRLYLHNVAGGQADQQTQCTHVSLQGKGYTHGKPNEVIADEVDDSP